MYFGQQTINTIATRLLWEKLTFYNITQSRRFLDALHHSTSSKQQQQQPGHYTYSLEFVIAIWRMTDLKLLLTHIPNLKHLKIYNTSCIPNSVFQHIPYYCQQLTTLEIRLYDMYSDSSFYALGKYCHQLTDLKWDMGHKGSLLYLSALEDCSTLKRLTIFQSDTTELIQDNAVRAIQRLHHLTHLHLGYSTDQLTASLLPRR